MSNPIVGLDGKPVAPDINYNPGVLDALERALSDAKKEKVSAAIVTLIIDTDDKDNDDRMIISTFWHGRRLSLLAGLSRATYRINLNLDDDTEVVR